jgi:hypothetical protein
MNEIQTWKVAPPLKAEVDPLPLGGDVPDYSDPPVAEWRPGYVSLQGNDARSSQRYPAVAGRSWLGWHEATAFRQVAAWILNISASGCLVAVDERAAENRALWLRLDNPSVPDWAEVRVIEHLTTNSGLLASRLVFRGNCPYEVIKAVAFGATQQPHRPEPSRSWISNTW